MMPTEPMPEWDDKHFIEDCRFAKVVKTAKGDALLIQGLVIGMDCDPAIVAAVAKALRSPASLTSSMTKSMNQVNNCGLNNQWPGQFLNQVGIQGG